MVRDGDLVAAEITVRGDKLEVGRIQRLFGGVQSVDGPQGYVYDIEHGAPSSRGAGAIATRAGPPFPPDTIEVP